MVEKRYSVELFDDTKKDGLVFLESMPIGAENAKEAEARALANFAKNRGIEPKDLVGVIAQAGDPLPF